MYNASGSDVLTQAWMVVKVLGPLYAIIFGLVGAQRLIEIAKLAILPPHLKRKPHQNPEDPQSMFQVIEIHV